MNEPTLTTTTSTDPAAGFLLFMAVGCLVYFLIYVVPIVITQWRLFSKAGQPGWAAIVPIYNIYVANEVARLQILWFILSLFVPFVSLYVYYKLFESFGKGIGPFLVFLFVPIITVFTMSKWQYQAGAAAGTMPSQPMQPQPEAAVAPALQPQSEQNAAFGPAPVEPPVRQAAPNPMVAPAPTPQPTEPVVRTEPNPFQPAQPQQPSQSEQPQELGQETEPNRDQTPPQGPMIQ